MSTLLARAASRLAAQRKFMASCGGDLTGYIARYGDPGVPPLDEEGNPIIVTVDPEDAHLFKHLKLVEDQDPWQPKVAFYAPHVGDGGTAIYKADYHRLRQLEQEYQRLQGRYGRIQ